jgi:hypothetical protein
MEALNKLFGDNSPKAEDLPPIPAELVVEPQSAPPPPVREEPTLETPSVMGPALTEPAVVVPQPHQVPITALLDEREKRQAAERDQADLKRRIAEFESRKEAPKVPDMFADPEGYAQHTQRQIAETEARVTQRISGVMAVQAYGEEVVKAAEAWANKNPAVLAEAMASSHPYDHAVKAYKQHQDMQSLGGKSLNEYMAAQVAAELAKHGITIAPGAAPVAAPAPSVSNPAPPPRSIANAPTANGPKGGYERPAVLNKLFGAPG